MNRIFSSSIIDRPANPDDKDLGKVIGSDIGTKLISQGTFGCIFYPAIECDGSISKNKKYASKLVKNNKTDLNEYLINNFNRSVDSQSWL